MKNKNLIVAMSKLFKIDEKVIIDAFENEAGDDSIIKDFNLKNQVYTAQELSALLKNSQKQYLETADFDINEVPKNLYSKIVAAAFEKKEKDLAKEYGIASYDNLQDLLHKAIESKTGKGVDELGKQQIETLKATIKTLEQEKETAVNEVRRQFDSEFISRDFNSALLAQDFKGDKTDPKIIENKRKLISSAFNSEFKINRKNNNSIVLDKDGKTVLNKLGETETISNVLKTFATGYGYEYNEPDTGGRGASSSESTISYKGISFDKMLETKGIKPLTAEADAAFVEWQTANK